MKVPYGIFRKIPMREKPFFAGKVFKHEGKTIFYRTASREEALLLMNRAYSIDLSVFNRIYDEDVVEEIWIEDGGRCYVASIELWADNGLIEDHGEDDQIYLVKDDMEKKKKLKTPFIPDSKCLFL